MTTRTFPTKCIRPLSSTRSAGRIISPSTELRKLKEGHFLIVDDARSRHHMINAAHRMGIHITTRRTPKGTYEVHRVVRECPHPLYEYPV